MQKLWVVILMVGVMVSAAWAGSGPDIKEGEWDMTMETEIPGMPVKMPPIAYSQCITKDTPIPENQQPNQDCRMVDTKTSGNTVSWVVKCNGPEGEMTGSGSVTYQDDQMNGSMVMETQGMKINTRMKGHYVGPCNK